LCSSFVMVFLTTEETYINKFIILHDTAIYYVKCGRFTDENEMILCEISSSHGSEYDVQNCLLGCTAV
jgi:hypothetical protein